jgi:hypothetical protein
MFNLDKQATVNSLNEISGWHEDLDQLNIQFETVKYPEKHL